MPSLLMSVIDSSVGIDRRPGRRPCRQLSEAAADEVGVDVELGEHREARRGEVEQEDEEQRPEHRLPRLPHARRRVVAHQDVRQRRRAEHHAEHDAEEVAAARCRAPSRPCRDTASRAAAAVARAPRAPCSSPSSTPSPCPDRWRVVQRLPGSTSGRGRARCPPWPRRAASPRCAPVGGSPWPGPSAPRRPRRQRPSRSRATSASFGSAVIFFSSSATFCSVWP